MRPTRKTSEPGTGTPHGLPLLATQEDAHTEQELRDRGDAPLTAPSPTQKWRLRLQEEGAGWEDVQAEERVTWE